MKSYWRCGALVVPGLVVSAVGGGLAGQTYGEPARHDVTARVWFDRGEEPVLRRGDRTRVYYRTDRDAYVAIFQIDTNGTTRLLFPASPADRHYVRGGRDYRLLLRGGRDWYPDEAPGMGYFFIVASPVPFDFSYFDYVHHARSWDLTRVGSAVYSDPYVAMDEYVAALLPDWDRVPFALDFATYHVGRERYDFPRFVCYDCHGFRTYTVWNPYLYSCSSFRLVIFDDPYFYPSRRYRGTRVVYARPSPRAQPRFAFKERAWNETARPLVTRREGAPPVIDRSAVRRRPGSTDRTGRGVLGSRGEERAAPRGGTPRNGVARSARGRVVAPRRTPTAEARPSRPTTGSSARPTGRVRVKPPSGARTGASGRSTVRIRPRGGGGQPMGAIAPRGAPARARGSGGGAARVPTRPMARKPPPASTGGASRGRPPAKPTRVGPGVRSSSGRRATSGARRPRGGRGG